MQTKVGQLFSKYHLNKRENAHRHHPPVLHHSTLYQQIIDRPDSFLAVMATSQVSDHTGSAAFLEFKDIIAEVALCSGSSWTHFEEEPRNRLLRTSLGHSPRVLKMTQITQHRRRKTFEENKYARLKPCFKN